MLEGNETSCSGVARRQEFVPMTGVKALTQVEPSQCFLLRTGKEESLNTNLWALSLHRKEARGGEGGSKESQEGECGRQGKKS